MDNKQIKGDIGFFDSVFRNGNFPHKLEEICLGHSQRIYSGCDKCVYSEDNKSCSHYLKSYRFKEVTK